MKTKITIIMTLVAALLLSIAAYAKGEINDEVNEPDAVSFQAYVDANTKEELLKRHQIFRIVLNEYRDGVIGETLHYYLDNDYAAWNFDYGVNWLNGHEYTLDSYIDGDTPYYVTYLSKQAEYHDEILDWARGNEFLCLTEPDRIVETIDNGGGTFSGVIEFNDPEKVKNNIAENAPDLPDDLEYEEGMAIRYNYIFSTETKDLLEYDTFLVIAGKEPVLLNVATFFYDGETYDPFEKGEPFAAYSAAMDDPGQFRTITVIFDPNTKDELEMAYSVPKNTALRIINNSERVQNIYTDRECTQLYDDSERGAEDLTLYVPTEARPSE